jgi:hypothetical protein
MTKTRGKVAHIGNNVELVASASAMPLGAH